MTETRPAPYPADTRAKGWRFELDLERIEQSDTWALATPDVRPWLFLLWAKSWQQVPCGSLPDDDALIAARIGMPIKAFMKARTVLLRGWWLAEDGRLYHDVIAARVQSMLDAKRKESERKAAYRAKMDAERGMPSASVPPVSHGTTTGLHPPSTGCDATGTSTGTGTGLKEKEKGRASAAPPPNARPPDLPEPDTSGHQPTQAGAICRAMKVAGLQSVNPGDPRLLALIEQGATEAEFVGIAAEAVEKRKGFAWVLVALQARRADAADIDLAPAAGSSAWHETLGGVNRKANELGLQAWDGIENWPAYRARVIDAAKEAA